MTSKEMKKLRQSIRTELNTAGHYISLAQIGVAVGSTPSNSEETRKFVVRELTASKEKLQKYLEKYGKCIDEAIELMS